MNIEEFLVSLDALGPNLEQWPNSRQAYKLLDGSTDAKEALTSARNIEDMFLNDAVTQPDHLAARISGIADAATPSIGSKQSAPTERVLQFSWGSAVAALIPLALGFAVGLAVGLQNPTKDPSQQQYASPNSWVYADTITQSSTDFAVFLEEQDHDSI